MFEVIQNWYQRTFSDPQAVLLVLILMVGFSIVLFMGHMLAPVLASLVIAYLLEGIIKRMERRGALRIPSVLIVYLLFLAFVIFVIFGLVPMFTSQLTQFITELPRYISAGQQILLQLPQHYSFVSEQQVTEVVSLINRELTGLGKQLLSISLSSIPGLIAVVVYLILVPLLVFFFLKDKQAILNWFSGFLPNDRRLASQVWEEMDRQLGNYIRGKFWEILIVGVATFIAFIILDFKYALLLSVLVGLSVLIPYIGAAVVTIPVALVALFQWGWSSDFVLAFAVYLVIQGLDGNLLVPYLFSEVTNLHPIAIIVSILVFGGLWGFWGVFFAIPLATLVNAVLRAWPRPTSIPVKEGEVIDGM